MRWLALIATMADLLLSPLVPASAQEAKGTFPHRPIHIVTPIAPGGNMDLSVRVFAEKLAAMIAHHALIAKRLVYNEAGDPARFPG